jgi:hypothetical protein
MALHQVPTLLHFPSNITFSLRTSLVNLPSLAILAPFPACYWFYDLL